MTSVCTTLELEYDPNEAQAEGAGWFAYLGKEPETIGHGRTAWEAIADAVMAEYAYVSLMATAPSCCPYCAHLMDWADMLVTREYSSWHGQCPGCQRPIRVDLDAPRLLERLDVVTYKRDLQ